jgi:hypothetical protein
VRSLLADLAGGPGPGDVQLPRAGLLRLPDHGGSGAAAPDGTETAAAGSASRLLQGLAERGIRPVRYADWLRIEQAEAELGASLGRGGRVKLSCRADLLAACMPSADEAAR